MSNTEDFVIEDGVLKKYRGNDTAVIIPDGVKCIGDSAFGFCKNLITVMLSDSVERVCSWAFHGCIELSSITLGAGITDFSGWALESCCKLETIAVNENNSCYSSVDGVLFDKSKAKLVKFPCGKKITEYSIPDGVTEIGTTAFSTCSKLESIIIPDSVTTIGENAFLKCEALTSIIIPDSVTRICYQAFADCCSLTSVKLSNGLKKLESGVFSFCESIQSIIIPDSVESIGKNVFYLCKNLSAITFSSNLKKISEYAFSSCHSLECINLPLNIEEFNGSVLEVIWDYFYETRHRLCLECTFLTKALPVVLGNKQLSKLIKSDKQNIFARVTEGDDTELMESLLALYKHITVDTLDRYIEKVGSAVRVKAFLLDYKANKYSVEKQEEYENVKTEKALGLRERTVTDWKKIYNFTTENDKITITRYRGTDTHIEIPEKIGKYTVVAIGERVFSPEVRGLRAAQKEARTKIQSVVVPCGVTSIGEEAFLNCHMLESVWLSEKVEYIGENAFDGCNELTIYAPEGSIAEYYARKNGISFVTE